MTGLSICFSFIGGVMLGLEFVPNTRMMILDLLILRISVEVIPAEDIENDQ